MYKNIIGSMKMRRKALLLIGMLLMCFVTLSKVSIAYAQESAPLAVENPSVNYATHVQDIGWQNSVSDGDNVRYRRTIKTIRRY